MAQTIKPDDNAAENKEGEDKEGQNKSEEKMPQPIISDIGKQIQAGRVLDKLRIDTKFKIKSANPKQARNISMSPQTSSSESQEGSNNEGSEDQDDDQNQEREETGNDNKNEEERRQSENNRQTSEQETTAQKRPSGSEKRQAELMAEKENGRRMRQAQMKEKGSASTLQEGAQKIQATAKKLKKMAKIWRGIAWFISFLGSPVGIAILVVLFLCLVLLLIKMALDDPCGLLDAVGDDLGNTMLSMMGLTCTILNK